MPKSPLILVLLLALGVRAVAAFALEARLGDQEQRFLFGDSVGYWILAEQIRQGGPYQFGAPEASVVRMPGFPLLLAGIFLTLGDKVLVVRLVLALVGTLACGVVYELGRQLFDRRVGLLAASVAAVYPSFVLFSVLVLSETWFVLLMLANLIGLARLVEQPPKRNRTAFASGLLAGAATLVRPSWILFSPLVLAIRAAAGPQRQHLAKQTAFLLLGIVTILAPWWIRNYRVTGRFVPTTLWMGASLYDGLNPAATGASDMSFLPAFKAMQLGEFEQDRYLRRAALEFARENPRRAVELAGIKLLRYWSPRPHAAAFRSRTAGVVLGLSYVPILALAIAGAWRFRKDRWKLTILVAPIVYFCLVHLVFASSIRYRLPGMYPVIILAGAWLVARVASRDESSEISA